MTPPAADPRERRASPRMQGSPGWDAALYLRQFYSTLEQTERHTLGFLAEALRDVGDVSRALDFGSGPTLHHAIALAGRADEVHLCDAAPENLQAIRAWVDGSQGAHDWSPLTREILRLEGRADPTEAELRDREERCRRRVTRLFRGDARRQRPLDTWAPRRYEMVTSFFCADSITGDLREWQRCARHIARLVAPGGTLVLGALRQCRAWRLGDLWLPSPCIDERHVQFLLDAAGFEQEHRRVEVAPVPDQADSGFSSILLVSARAPAGQRCSLR